jgi:hypothetical protein
VIFYEDVEVWLMARKRFSEEDILGLLRQIELGLASGIWQ